MIKRVVSGHRRWLLAAGSGLIAGLASASTYSSTPQVAIDGAVTWLGRPAAQAVVEFIPMNPPDPPIGTDTVLIDQRNLRFTPNVIGVTSGTVVEFRNSDPIMHNVFSPVGQGADFDLGTYPQEESRTHTFDDPGTYVILCHVHPEMAAWVVVSESPYVVVTDEDGRFTLDPVPAGEYQTTVWYRRRSASGGTISVREAQGEPVLIEIGR